MKILDRYIVKTTAFYTLAVLAGWLSIYGFFNFIEEIKSIGRVNYTAFDAFAYVVLDLPAVMYSHASVVILLGTLLALGHLASTSQLVVIRGCGLSILQITKTVVKAAMLFLLVIALIGEFVSPMATTFAESLRAVALGETTKLKSQQGFWLKDGNTIIKVGKHLDGKTFENVTLFKHDAANKLTAVIQAERGIVDNDQLKLNQPAHYSLNRHENLTKIEQQVQPVYNAKVSFNKNLLDSLKKYPQELSSIYLFKQIDFLKSNNISAVNYEVELYKRIVKPITLIAMIITAMLFVFGSLRDASLGKKIFLGIVLSFCFELSSKIGGALSLRYDINPLFSAVTPTLVVLVLSLFLLYKKSLR